MRILKARFGDGGELLRHYLPSLPEGGLFFATREALPEGTPVAVEVRFPELRGRVMLRGAVAWRRAGRHRTKLRAGVGVAFNPAEERKRDFLLAAARNGEAANARRHRRLPVSLDVAFRVAGAGERRGRLDNIGAGGALIATDEPLAPGTELVLDVTPPGGLLPLAIAARVAWARPEEGCGVAFRCRDAGGARRLRELVRRLETQPN